MYVTCDKARKNYYPKPCHRFSKIDKHIESEDHEEEEDDEEEGHRKKRDISEAWILSILYPEDMKVITQSKEVDEHALIGNIGGYVGLFLGNMFTYLRSDYAC